MEELPVAADPSGTEHAEIDRCERCGGLFLEFFDGEPSALSRAWEGGADPRAPLVPERPITCPDCESPMVERAYLGHGPRLPRCETCLAVFLTPASRQELARMSLPREREPEPGWLERALAWARGLG